MFRFIVLALVVFTNGESKSIYQERIVGGNSTNIEKYPYQVSVQYFSFLLCGGSIISPTYVITAAHCTHKQSALALNVRASSNTTTSSGQFIPVKEIFENPLYNIDTMDYDISILLLYNSIQFGPAAMPIKLPPKNFVLETNTVATVTGWGTLEEDGDVAEKLQVVNITTISNRQCGKAYEFFMTITPRMVCAQEKGKDSCQGDSGGPMVVDDFLVGIVSWGLGCADPNYPGVYSRVSEFRDFIKNVTQI